MPRAAIYLSLLVLIQNTITAQLKVVKPAETHARKTNLALGGGITRSVLYLSRNVKEDIDAIGYTASLMYGGNKLTRTIVEYTYYRKINIEPTWYNIKAYSLEANVHFIARFKSKKAIFYPLFGLSYNVFSGFFTGENDFLRLIKLYTKNQQVTTRWVGLNAGTGFEYFFKPGSFFVDYKMRIGFTEGTSQFNIMDVCFSGGLRFNLRVPTIYQIFKGARGRYFVDTVEDE